MLKIQYPSVLRILLRTTLYVLVLSLGGAMHGANGMTNSLVPGQTTNGVISLGATNFYAFSANSNDVVTIFMVETDRNGTPVINLFDPSKMVVASAAGENWPWSSIIQGHRLTQSGRYTIQCTAQTGAATYPFSITLVTHLGNNVIDRDDAAGSILPGQTLSNNLALPADMDVFTFVANSNDTLTIFMVGPAGSEVRPGIVVFSPDGEFLTQAGGENWPNSSIVSDHRLSQRGIYTILCRDDIGDETYAYGLTLVKCPGTNQVDAVRGQESLRLEKGAWAGSRLLQTLTSSVSTP